MGGVRRIRGAGGGRLAPWCHGSGGRRLDTLVARHPMRTVAENLVDAENVRLLKIKTPVRT